MCGIVGYWQSSGPARAALAAHMALQIQHRGPDDHGVWIDESAGLALAHRRLSIVDLSPAGHQPMCSPCGRWVLVFNGEIYNHQELRNELDSAGGGFAWRGHSDTETLLAALCYWGIRGTLDRLNGMFAFAFLDTREQVLHLARDRMGEKPLYYGYCGNALVFGSELKALTVHPEWQGEISREALALYMRYGYVPAPLSIYKGIHKLMPAHHVVVSDGGRSIGTPIRYWDHAKAGAVAESERDSDTLIQELDVLLGDAVSRRMIADVPLGAFLSGGIDSSAIVALMQAQSRKPTKTFTIGFHEEDYDEAKHAKKIAAHLGTEHTEFYVSPETALSVIPKLPSIYDEPFADQSQIPTFLVSQLARQHVTVSLSGDGGDELFMGYERYFITRHLWNRISSVPTMLRAVGGKVLSSVPECLLSRSSRLMPRGLRIAYETGRLQELMDALAAERGDLLYHQIMSHWNPDRVVVGPREHSGIRESMKGDLSVLTLDARMALVDMSTYLPDDILVKVDRASMAVGLESRAPFLDHRLVEFSSRVPIKYKFRDGTKKWLLRKVLDKYVPHELLERPKMGFGIPLEQWLRGPIREWADALLDENRLRREGYFDPVPIRKMWNEHVAGIGRWHSYLWVVIMFQAWLDGNKKHVSEKG